MSAARPQLWFDSLTPPESGVDHVRSQWRQSPVSPAAQEENREAQANPRTDKPGLKIQVSNPSFQFQTTGSENMTSPIRPAASEPNTLSDKADGVLLVDGSRAKGGLRAELK